MKLKCERVYCCFTLYMCREFVFVSLQQFNEEGICTNSKPIATSYEHIGIGAFSVKTQKIIRKILSRDRLHSFHWKWSSRSQQKQYQKHCTHDMRVNIYLLYYYHGIFECRKLHSKLAFATTHRINSAPTKWQQRRNRERVRERRKILIFILVCAFHISYIFLGCICNTGAMWSM